MMDIASIVHMNSQIGAKAAARRKEPYVLSTCDELGEKTLQLIPLLGDYVPKGWKLLDDPAPMLCDKTGLGLESEPALTVKRLIETLKQLWEANPEYGYGIIEMGPFQAVLGVFLPE